MEIYFPIKHRRGIANAKRFYAENWFSVSFVSRSSKPERNDELQHIERQVEKYRDVLHAISKKVSASSSLSGQDPVAREKRLKKIHEHILGQAMEDSAKELPDDTGILFRKILDYCGE